MSEESKPLTDHEKMLLEFEERLFEMHSDILEKGFTEFGPEYLRVKVDYRDPSEQLEGKNG